MKKICYALLLCLMACQAGRDGTTKPAFPASQPTDIQPWEGNSRFWAYEGQPTLLLGGSKDDNLFQFFPLSAHLDSVVAAGGNYLRCVMSSRQEQGGELAAFAQQGSGLYDLNQWNPVYWSQFEDFLRLTHDRNIIVQVEIWATHDFYNAKDSWKTSPWHPDNNLNYTFGNTRLPQSVDRPPKAVHPFFHSVPALNNDSLLLRYQKAFVQKLLSHSLQYDHVLYTMTNEIPGPISHEWGWFWSDFVRNEAAREGKRVYTSEMYWEPDLTDMRQDFILEHPARYDFFEASQNSANFGQQHWDFLHHVWQKLSAYPRPINHDKTYGADTSPKRWTGKSKDGVDRFWKSLLGGAASCRFHRPVAGLGLSAVARHNIGLARKIEERIRFWSLTPRLDVLMDREEDEAYSALSDGNAWLVYFPAGGEIALDLPKGHFRLEWFPVLPQADETDYLAAIAGGNALKLSPPDENGWIALIWH
ncbi:MAG: DUF6298 domain-containing protein [Bacteroidota bacterium]